MNNSQTCVHDHDDDDDDGSLKHFDTYMQLFCTGINPINRCCGCPVRQVMGSTGHRLGISRLWMMMVSKHFSLSLTGSNWDAGFTNSRAQRFKQTQVLLSQIIRCLAVWRSLPLGFGPDRLLVFVFMERDGRGVPPSPRAFRGPVNFSGSVEAKAVEQRNALILKGLMIHIIYIYTRIYM